MKLKTTFTTTVVLFGLVFLVVLLSVVITNREVGRIASQEAIALRVERDASALSYLSNEYLLYRETQQRTRWNTVFADLVEGLSALELDDAQQQKLVDSLRDSSTKLKAIFDESTKLDTTPVSLDSPSSPAQVQGSRLGVQTQTMDFDASRLVQQLHGESDHLRQINLVLVVGLAGLLGIYFVTNFALVYRRVLTSLAQLQAGALAIGTGDLDFRLPVLRADETGSLAQSFNRMAADLKSVTASKTNLEREMKERKRAEEALRESEERFRVAQESSPDGFSIQQPVRDAQGHVVDFTCVYVNPALERMVGLPQAALVGRRLLEIPSDRGSPFIDLYKHVAETGQACIQESQVEGDGILASRWFRLAVTAMGQDIAVHSQDITEHKRAEAALTESREKYQNLIETTSDFIWETDALGRYTYCSPQMKTLWGFDPQAMIGKTPFDQMSPEEGEGATQFYRGLAATPKAFTLQSGSLDAAGHTIAIDVSGVPFFDSTGKLLGYRGITRDITARKRAEEALRVSEEKFSKAFKNSPNAITITRLSDGRILEANESAYQLFGYSPEEVVGKTTSDLQIWAIPKERQRLTRALASKGFIQNEEFVLQKKDKTPIHVNLSAALMTLDDQACFLSSFIDITAKKLAEEALDESKRLLQSILDRSQDLIYRLDLKTGHFVYFNPAGEAILGYSAEEFTKVSPIGQLTVIHAEDVERMRSALERANHTGHSQVEYRFKTKSGEYRWLQANLSVSRDANGQPAYRDGIIRDVTERRRVEEDIQRLNRDLEARAAELTLANQDLESFAYSVSHDLRTPLSSIETFARLVLADFGGQLPEGGQRFLELIQANAQATNRLVDALLTFSRAGRQPVHRQSVAMRAVVDQVVGELRPMQVNRIVDWGIGDLPIDQADPVLIKQVWTNLLSNALKYSRPRERARIEIGMDTQNGEAVYFVKDNGVGFDMAQAGKLFGVFQRLHAEEEFEGTGVGLAIVDRIVRRHGGRVWAEAQVGQGATFHFTLGHSNADPPI